MTTKLFTAALAFASLTTVSGAFAADYGYSSRRGDAYQAPVYRPVPRPQPTDSYGTRYQRTDYRSQYERPDTYAPVYKPRRNGY